MQDTDAELLRLKDVERRAYERFLRLSKAGTFADHPEIASTAKILWEEATAAVLTYQRK
jgi:hypothetical protein